MAKSYTEKKEKKISQQIPLLSSFFFHLPAIPVCEQYLKHACIYVHPNTYIFKIYIKEHPVFLLATGELELLNTYLYLFVFFFLQTEWA